MIKIFSLVFLLNSFNYFSNSNDSLVYSFARDFIVSAESSKEYALTVFNTNEVNPYVSSELIPFNFSSIEVDVIRRKYLKGYNPFTKLSELEQLIERNVSDSLFNLNKDFQAKVKLVENPNLPLLSGGGQNNFIIFFSELICGVLYCELIPYNSKIYKNKKRDTVQYGKAITFLFEFDECGKVKKVFQGEVYYN